MSYSISRAFIFLFGCIGMRLAIVYAAKNASLRFLTFMAIPAIAIAIGFSTIFLFGWRQNGPEVLGENIWWNSLRPIHAFFWFAFAAAAILKFKHAWILLLIDTIIGITAFAVHRVWFR